MLAKLANKCYIEPPRPGHTEGNGCRFLLAALWALPSVLFLAAFVVLPHPLVFPISFQMKLPLLPDEHAGGFAAPARRLIDIESE